jgi:protein O-mannosyl-transferase
LCFDYGWNYGWRSAQRVGDALPELVIVGAMLVGTAWAWWRKPALGFLGVWFFMILAPTSSFVRVADLVVEHRMYLPLAAVVAMVTVGGFELGRNFPSVRQQTRRMLGWGVSGVLVLPLAILTIQRNRDYRSEFVLWQDTVVKCPNNPRAYNGLGLALWQAGRVQEAIGCYEQALRIKPNFAEAHNSFGNALLQLGKVQDAMGHYEQALRIKPNFAEAHYNLGGTLVRLGRVQEAIGHWEQAVRVKPDYAEAHYNLGVALERAGKLEDAIGHYEQALRIRPDYTEARTNLQLARQVRAKLQEPGASGQR